MEESQNIEWKESWRDEYLKWICGFANAQGGKIYIGVNDRGEVIGVENSKRLLEDIPNKIVSTLGIVADVNLKKEGDLDYIEIIVNANPYPVSIRGEYHYRTGSTKQQLTGTALNQFLLRKTGITWDSVPVDGIRPEEFRHDSFDIFREQAQLSKRMNSDALKVDNPQLLDNLNLLNQDNPTRAAILLFHHKPEKWIPGSYIKIGYFKTDSEIIYQDEVHGSLLSQADNVIELIYLKYLKGIISYDNITRVETYPYPKDGLREAVLNAMIQSMSRVGRCIDNGPMEGWWGILKSEMYYLRKFTDKDELISAIEEYICYYNTKRYQIKLSCMTPMEYHESYAA